MALTRITKGVIKPNENYDTHNINSTGIVTAIGLDVNGNGDISGNLNVGGVLTYEDVTSIDSVGIITARNDIHVGAGVSAVGVGTFGSLDIGGDIDVDGHTNLDNVSVAGVTTFAGNIDANGEVDILATDKFLTLKKATNGNYCGLELDRDNSGTEGGTIGLAGATGHFITSSSQHDLTIRSANGTILFGNGQTEVLRTNPSGITVTGTAVATGADINGDLDVDGHTNLDNVSIAGVTTITGSGNALEIVGRTLVGHSVSRVVGNITSQMQLEGTDASTGISICRNSNNSSAPYISLAKSRAGAVGGNTIIQDDDKVGEILFSGADGTDITNNAASITGAIDGTPGSNDTPGRLTFNTTADGGSNPTERLRITSAGKIGVGDADPIVQFHVKGSGHSHGGLNAHVSIEDTTSLAANVGGMQLFEGIYDSSGNPAIYAAVHGGKENATSGNYAGYLRFFTRANGSLPDERLRIKSTGAIIKGNSGTQVSLGNQANTQIIGSSSADSSMALIRTAQGGGEFYFAAGSSGTNIANNNGLGFIKFMGYHTDGYDEYARIQCYVDGTNGNGDAPGRITVRTTPDSSTTSIARVNIKSDGTIGIGDDVSPSAGDLQSGDSQNKPLIHVKGTGVSATGGEYNLLGRFEAGGDADNTGATIVLNHSNDRGLALQGGRNLSNRSFGAIKSVDNLGRLSNCIQYVGGNGQGVNRLEFYTGESTTTTERFRITSGGQVNIGGDYTQTSRFVNINGGSSVGQLQVKGTEADIWLHSTGPNGQWRILGSTGNSTHKFRIYDHTNSAERFSITSDGQIGVNNTSPDEWHTSYRSIQIHDAGVLYGSTDDSFVGLGANHYLNTSGNFIYSNTDFASRFYHVNGEFYFEGAASGTAGNSFSFTERLRITSTGQIRIDQATSANNGIRMRPSGWSYDFRMGAVSSSGGSIWLGQNYEPTGGTRDSSSYGTNYLRFTTQGEIMFGTGTTNTNPTERLKITNVGKVGINYTNPQTELNVIGSISAGRNVARELGTVINVSSNHGGRPGTNVINGNKNYEYQQDWLAAGGSRVNANLTIDLGSAKTCDRFVIYNQNEYDNSRREVKNFTLEGSNDNSNWTTILDDDCGASGSHEPNPGFSFRIPASYYDDNEGLSYRYWRFTMKTFHGSDSYGGICELELYEVGDTTVSANKVGSEITTHSLNATDMAAETLQGIKRLYASKGMNIYTSGITDTWELTETGIVTSGGYQDKSTIRHKRGVMAVSSSYNSGDLYVRIDNLYNLPGNAWWTFSLLVVSAEVVGTLAGHHSYFTSLLVTGLGSWSSVGKTDIVGTMNVSVSSHGSNFVELFINVNDSSRGPCTVICNGGTFDPPRISFS